MNPQNITSLVGITLSFVGIILSFGGIILSLLSIIFAVREGRKSALEYKNALSLSKEYHSLVEEYRGQILDWEDLITELAKQVENEKEEICLALDTLAYGAVTVPDAHKKFWGGLLSKAAMGLNIKIITFNQAAQIQMLSKQFGPEVALEPTKDEHVSSALEHHERCINTLRQEGGDNIEIHLASYFPLHLFIFKFSNLAIIALQDVVGEGKVRARAIKTNDTIMIQICKQSFNELSEISDASIAEQTHRNE